MGYSLSCGDVMEGCDARFEGETEDEVLGQAGRHASEVHGIEEMTPEVMEAVRGAMRTS